VGFTDGDKPPSVPQSSSSMMLMIFSILMSNVGEVLSNDILYVLSRG
jgi:hypothetical protein